MMAARTDTVPVGEATGAGEVAGRPRMWHAAWRQHRAWVIATLALGLLGAVALVAAVALVPACASTARSQSGVTCQYEPANSLWGSFVVGMLTLPVLVGVILGAVTFGPDVDHRTQVFALTQGVSRTRWWAAKVVVMGAPVFLAFALLGLAALWVVNASDDWIISTNRLTSPGFDTIGLIPATRFLVAYAAAAAAALLWRTVGGLVAGLVVAAVVLTLGTLLQPLVVPHQRELIPITTWLSDSSGMLSGGSGSAYEVGGYADSAGRDIDSNVLNCESTDFAQCLTAAHVIYRVETYVTDDQFSRMTIIISGLNVVLAGALLGWGVRGLRRRDL